MRSRTYLVSLVTALVLTLPGCGPGDLAGPDQQGGVTDPILQARGGSKGPRASTIVFLSDATGDPEIWEVAIDGSGLSQFAAIPGANNMPDRFGDEVVYGSWGGSGGDLHIVSRTGALRQLTFGMQSSYNASWSPDGGQIIFESAAGTYLPWLTRLYIIDADGSNLRRVTADDKFEGYPSWAPDMSAAVFHSYFSGNWELHKVEFQSGAQTNLTQDPSGDFDPSWSWATGRIAFVSERAGGTHLFSMREDGSDVVQVTKTVNVDRCPHWTADGRSLVFQRMQNGNWDLYIIKANGRGERPLVATPANETLC